MVAAVLAFVLAVAVLATLAFVALVVGIHIEPSHDEMRTIPVCPLAALTRRVLGVSVRRPADLGFGAYVHHEPSLTGLAFRPDDEGR